MLLLGWVGKDWVDSKNFLGLVYVVDVCMGELKWKFYFIFDDYFGKIGVVNVWIVMLVDEVNGLVYLFVLLFSLDFYGGDRKEIIFYVILVIVLNGDIGEVVWLW